MEEELHDRPLYREFAGLAGSPRLPEETTILRFRHLLEKHDLAARVIIAAPSSTKNKDGERDPEMHQTKKRNAWHFGMKAHISGDAESGSVHTVIGTAASVNDVTQGAAMLHGEEAKGRWCSPMQATEASTNGTKPTSSRRVAMQPGKRGALNPKNRRDRLLEKVGKKASVRAKVEHPLRAIKQQFRYAKVRYRGLAKNTAGLAMLFAMSNLRMVRKQLMEAQG